MTLGREPSRAPASASALVNALQVSREHAQVTSSAGRLTITDLGASNGTTVNGARLAAHAAQELLEGDVLVLGGQVQYVVRRIDD